MALATIASEPSTNFWGRFLGRGVKNVQTYAKPPPSMAPNRARPGGESYWGRRLTKRPVAGHAEAYPKAETDLLGYERLAELVVVVDSERARK